MGTQARPVIQVKNLYKVYRVGDSHVRALDGVNLEIYKGEFCSIVGTSGSGKSTLLNMLAGLEKPTKGEIIIAGEHMENKTENQLVKFRREHIGFIFQSFNLMGTAARGRGQGAGGESGDYFCGRAYRKPGFQYLKRGDGADAEGCQGTEADAGYGNS